MLLHLLLPIGFTLSPLLGWVLDMHWLTLVLAMLVLPLAEWLFGRAAAHRHDPVRAIDSVTINATLNATTDGHNFVAFKSPNYQWQPWLLRSVMLMVLVVCIGFALHSPQMASSSFWLLALSCGYVAGGIGIVLAHELGHRRALIDRALARTLLCWIGYGHYAIEHNRGHHRAAATYADPASARQDESLWRFMPRYFSGVFIHAVRLSRQKPGRINEALALTAVSVLLGLTLVLFASVEALGFVLITAAVAQTLVATVDYVEHWGLQRVVVDGKPERMAPQHIWDCANSISDALLFNLPRHAAHHLEPSLDCNALRRVNASPQMPTGYAGMSLLSAIWPLYRHIMTPRLPSAAPAAANMALHA
jgi:alkane 1-monooxygenase